MGRRGPPYRGLVQARVTNRQARARAADVEGFGCLIFFHFECIYKAVTVFCCVWLSNVTDARQERELGCAIIPTSTFYFSCLQILQGSG